MPNYLVQSFHFPHDTILTINTIMIAIFSLLIAETLISYTRHPLAASVCLIISGSIALLTVLFMQEKYQLGLEKI